MLLLKKQDVTSDKVVVRTDPETDPGPQTIASGATVDEHARARWSQFIDQMLEWWRDPGLLEDDDFLPPNRKTIDKTIRLAHRFKGEGDPPPLRIIPDGDGGISIEWTSGSVSLVIEIPKSGPAELTCFKNCRVIEEYQFGLD